MIRRDCPIVIGGCHRSGTSLLRRVLNAHSRIHCGPEVTFFRDLYGDYPPDPLGHLRFFRTARSLLPESDLLEIAGSAFVRLHERAAFLAGKTRWADKSPDNVLHLREWQQLLGDDWLFVHVVRNPLDTLASIKAVRFPLTIPAALDDRIAWYRRYTEAGLAFEQRDPDRYVRLPYEDLVLAPDTTLPALMERLGEAVEPRQFQFNDAPQQPGLEDPLVAETTAIHAASVGRWRAALDEEEVAAIRQATGELWAAISSGHAAAARCA